MKFQWSTAKQSANIVKHGVDFAEAQLAFADPQALVLFDSAHSSTLELRWWLLGKVGSRVMLVRYTHRPAGVIRIIGAGYWKEGCNYYETYWKTHSLEGGL